MRIVVLAELSPFMFIAKKNIVDSKEYLKVNTRVTLVLVVRKRRCQHSIIDRKRKRRREPPLPPTKGIH